MADLRRAVANMFMVGFPGTDPDEPFLRLVEEGLFGAILFKRNVTDARGTAELVRKVKSRAARPFVFSVDQEGGRVARLRGAPFTALPPMRHIGQNGDAALAERAGRLLAYELRALGFDWDFAPVLDVDTNPKNPVIGDRSFHREATVVSKMGIALARGLEAGGVASCAKHFPGHGDTEQDSHHVLPRLAHPIDRLRRVELPPFHAYAEAKLASVMTAHVIFDAVDPGVPATMSPLVLEGMLRAELGFGGVIVSDDLEMKAIADNYSVPEAAVLGVLAGVDLFLVCHHDELQRAAIDAVVSAVKSGRIAQRRIEESNLRLHALSSRFARPAEDLVERLGSKEHRELAAGFEDISAGADPTEANYSRKGV